MRTTVLAVPAIAVLLASGAAGLLPRSASAAVTCVTDKKTGSSTNTADCATCEHTGGCCYYKKGDCATTAIRRSDLEGGFTCPGCPGTGVVYLFLDTVRDSIEYTLQLAGLSGPPTSVEVRGPALEGDTADVVFTLPNAVTGAGVVRLDSLPGYGVVPQKVDLQDGKWYVLVRTAAHPEGEIRGQFPSSTVAVANTPPGPTVLRVRRNPTTIAVEFVLPGDGSSADAIDVFDANGRLVHVLPVGGEAGPRVSSWDWKATGNVPGVYFARLRSRADVVTRVVLIP